MYKVIFLLLVGLSFASCHKDQLEAPVITKSYLHLAHTRAAINPDIDSLAALIDYEQYDMLWLGGDLAQATSRNANTMEYVDAIFDLDAPTTLWALGNHDYDDLTLVESFTKRPPYYTFHQDGITFIVLDTQDSLSHIVGDQRDFLNGVLDTLASSTHLIVLHHKLIWMYDNTDLVGQISAISNGNLGDCFFCLNPNNFNSELYPKLVEVRQKGIEVLCIGGDIGFRAKEFSYVTTEGIHFLASGIEYNEPDNKALLFHHEMNSHLLTWEFVPLVDL